MATKYEKFEELCERVCATEGWERLADGVRVSLPNGRHQQISTEYFEFDNREMVRFFTRIGSIERLSEEQLVAALRVNTGLAHGALAVREDDLVMVDTQVLDDADLGEVKSSIDFLARTSDSYEKVLFGIDEF